MTTIKIPDTPVKQEKEVFYFEGTAKKTLHGSTVLEDRSCKLKIDFDSMGPGYQPIEFGKKYKIIIKEVNDVIV